ncbi:MAG: TolC family protein [Myxococcales bacterium]|nr:TolC family protein [Myxococcales bacterium]
MTEIALILAHIISAHSPSTELSLPQVLSSVDSHHPKIVVAIAKERGARGQLLAAQGGFDPQLKAYGAMREGGYYELRRISVEARQPTPLWGTELWAGYRLGQETSNNNYPSYYGDETLDIGEIRAGLDIPLWRDGPLDKRRANQAKAHQKVNAAVTNRQATQLELRKKATDAYFAWIAAGKRLTIAKDLLALAEHRQGFVDARVEAGAIPAIEALEATRSVLRRQSLLVSAQRSIEAAALILSIFYRDQEGRPVQPPTQTLPMALDTPSPLPSSIEDSISDAIACHPRIQEGRAELASATIEADLAKAQNAPEVDLKAQISRDFGEGAESLPGTVFELNLVFQMPTLLRTPRGELRAARAQTQLVQQELRLLSDTIQMRIANAASAFAAADKKRNLAQALIENTNALAQGERKRFEAGITTLFVVNLREQSLAEAEFARIEAIRDLWKARAEWDALTACATSMTK